jgi:peptidoglycan/LPS O-acetylase OafA/YrhL
VAHYQSAMNSNRHHHEAEKSRVYRADIDGLRALAVLAVMAFHAAPGQFRGGFTGVDVFFVISGFLITQIIADTSGQHRWLLAFYTRRVRRILPALLVVLSITTPTAALLLASPDFEVYLRHLFATTTFVPNLLFMGEAGYFDFAASKPLLHLWSLGVEEQFYLVWPVIVVLALRWRRPFAMIASILVISFFINIAGSTASAEANFYSPLSRAWQLASGAAVAIGMVKMTPLLPWEAHATSLLGGFLLVLGFLFIRPGGGYPGWWAIVPTAAATLLIVAGPSACLNRHLLARRTAISIGLISYPLYLWHWPLISFASTITLDELPWSWRLSAVIVSFPAAWLTYRFVEQPARRGGLKTTRFLLGTTALLAVVAASWSQAPEVLRPPSDLRREFVAHYRHLPLELARSSDDCSLGRTGLWRRSALPPQCVEPGKVATWLLWGDSHARALAPGLRGATPEGTRLAVLTGSGCRPLTQGTGLCAETNQYGMALVRRLQPSIVFLVQQGGHEQQDWAEVGRRLEAAGAGRVIVIGPVPQWRRSLPQIAATHFWPQIPIYIGRELDRRVMQTDRKLKAQIGVGARTQVISLVEPLCLQVGCRAVVPGRNASKMIHMDYGHLTPEGARFVAENIILPQVAALVAENRRPLIVR